MNEKLATWVVAITALACVASARAHHSVGMFDLATPIWIKGSVVRYDPVNPHALFALDVRKDDGQVQQWTVEGPSLNGLRRRGVPVDFLKVGDVIEVCGFPFKEDVLDRVADARRVSQPFMHGHVLVIGAHVDRDAERAAIGAHRPAARCRWARLHLVHQPRVAQGPRPRRQPASGARLPLARARATGARERTGAGHR